MTRPTRASGRVGIAARRTEWIAVACGLLAAGVAAVAVSLSYVPLIGWDVAAVAFLLATWLRIGRLDGAATAADAGREDTTRAVTDLVLLVAAVASLVAVGYMIVQSDGAVALHVGLGVASVIASWAVVHTIYALRYARLYYSGHDNSVNFNPNEPDTQPRFTDFGYLAFTVGMTYQVSDTDLRTSIFRGVVLRHALLSYLFGSVIVALLINLVAGLSR